MRGAPRRAALGSLTALTQLNGIKGFGADKFRDLMYSFRRCIYEVTAIIFDYHGGASGDDALNVRRNATTAAPLPEWRKGVSVAAADSPAMYSIRETAGNPIAIRAYLRANGIAGAFVRAVGGGRLGPVQEQYVTFDSFGASGYQSFLLPAPTFHAHGVRREDIAWHWQWRLKASDPWRTLLTTRHRIYVVLSLPTAPWVQTAGSTSLPWTDALDIACTWATGTTGAVAAASRVAQGYNGSGRVAYDTTSGATFYGSASYNLSEMIERLNGGVGLGGLVNCTDSANTVSTMANLLGCDLWQSRMSSSFRLNPMIAIGTGVWAIPFSGSFSYHEVAWTGACTEADRVFDGCLHVDGDADPTTAPHTPLLPLDMVFGNCATMNYRLRLCPPSANGCASCQPQPATTRKRRPVI